MPEGRSSISTAGFPRGLCRQHLRNGVQALRQLVVSKGSGRFCVGQGRPVARRYGQRHSEIHAPQRHYLGRASCGRGGFTGGRGSGLRRCSIGYCFLNTSFSVTRWPVSNVPVVVSVICWPSAETTHLSF